LKHCGLDVSGAQCLDAGQGTGGFTDVLLQSGAARVVGIDVGKGQLHPSLVAHPQVRSFEGVNARDVSGTEFAAYAKAGSFDFVTGDLSFISSTLVLHTFMHYLAPKGQLLLLIKPQFELQPPQIGKGGIVRNKALFADVETRIRTACRNEGFELRRYFQSPITGGNGNTEFFVWAQPGQPL
jgi:23S rRNA (cytidine1920-2'-O)/16S rRNA (cytidine1409-2'-O)-methyltransferase